MHRSLALLALVALAACSGGTTSLGTSFAPRDASAVLRAATPSPTPAAVYAGPVVDVIADVDRTHLPLGDGKVSSAPEVGYVDSCQQTFSTSGGGATVEGPWFNAGGTTWNAVTKIAVDGAVSWPKHTFATSVSGTTRSVTGNDEPDHTTGVFPIAKTDPAWAYDKNPGSIGAQTIAWKLPATPAVAKTSSCLSMGSIGILLTGAVIYDALDAEGRDAAAHEELDGCSGHPNVTEYHYHTLTGCLADPGSGHSSLLGYAADGFGIYGNRGEDGAPLTNADLDACHGHTHAISWNGQTVVMYHYHATAEYPYTLGCFRGTPIKT